MVAQQQLLGIWTVFSAAACCMRHAAAAALKTVHIKLSLMCPGNSTTLYKSMGELHMLIRLVRRSAHSEAVYAIDTYVVDAWTQAQQGRHLHAGFCGYT